MSHKIKPFPKENILFTDTLLHVAVNCISDRQYGNKMTKIERKKTYPVEFPTETQGMPIVLISWDTNLRSANLGNDIWRGESVGATITTPAAPASAAAEAYHE